MSCVSSEQLEAYCDGELPAGERELVEAHLKKCADCRGVSGELGNLSALIAGLRMAEAPAEVIGRFERAWEAGSDRGVLKISGWLTAAAAAVLMVAMIHRGRSEPGEIAGPALWQTVAAMSPDETQQDENRAELIVLAQWMSDDLWAGERQRQ